MLIFNIEIYAMLIDLGPMSLFQEVLGRYWSFFLDVLRMFLAKYAKTSASASTVSQSNR